jgi:hypothetical protein
MHFLKIWFFQKLIEFFSSHFLMQNVNCKSIFFNFWKIHKFYEFLLCRLQFSNWYVINIILSTTGEISPISGGKNFTFLNPNIRQKLWNEFNFIYIFSNFRVQLKTKKSAKSTNKEKLKINFSFAPLFFGS